MNVSKKTARPWLIRNEKDGYAMVLVPAGEFLMGSDPKRDSEAGILEQPQFRLNLPAYYIGLYPVMNRQYIRFLADSRYGQGGGSRLNEARYADHPVVDVNWHDANAYAKWAGLRLPSEAEWEKAARGTDGRIYPWGDAWATDRCRFDGNKGSEQTCAVWEYPSGTSPYGALNMSGNVWEWCADRWDSDAYKRYANEGYKPPTTGSDRVPRGGSWDGGAGSCRAGHRDLVGPSHRRDDNGFRLSRS